MPSYIALAELFWMMEMNDIPLVTLQLCLSGWLSVKSRR